MVQWKHCENLVPEKLTFVHSGKSRISSRSVNLVGGADTRLALIQTFYVKIKESGSKGRVLVAPLYGSPMVQQGEHTC